MSLGRCGLLVVISLAACATSRTSSTSVAIAPASEPPAEGVDPYKFPPMLGWQAEDGTKLDVRGPIWFQSGGERLLAAIVVRETAETYELVLVVARQRGAEPVLIATQLLATGTRVHAEDTTASLSRFPLGHGGEAVRADVGVYQGRGDKLFAVRASIVAVESDALVPLLTRVVDSGSDVRNQRASLAATDLDGDGRNEIVADESVSGGGHQRLVYRRSPGRPFETDGRSLFD